MGWWMRRETGTRRGGRRGVGRRDRSRGVSRRRSRGARRARWRSERRGGCWRGRFRWDARASWGCGGTRGRHLCPPRRLARGRRGSRGTRGTRPGAPSRPSTRRTCRDGARASTSRRLVAARRAPASGEVPGDLWAPPQKSIRKKFDVFERQPVVISAHVSHQCYPHLRTRWRPPRRPSDGSRALTFSAEDAVDPRILVASPPPPLAPPRWTRPPPTTRSSSSSSATAS